MTSNTQKCNTCGVVINELLAYIQNKISIADEISLVQICTSAFTCEQIEKANRLLLDSLPSNLPKTGRKGKGKGNRLLYDIINILKVTDPDVLPVFVARDLEKLPPITFDHLDVSKLLKDLVLVQAEINNIKKSYATVEQLESLKREYLNVKSPPFSVAKINLKRGANRDSGPMGLSQLDDTIITMNSEQCNHEVSSPRDYNLNLNYRSLDKNQLEGTNDVLQSTATQQLLDRCVTGNGSGLKHDVSTSRENESSRLTSEPTKQHVEAKEKQTYATCVKDYNENEGWKIVRRKQLRSKNRFIGKMGNVVVESKEKFRAADKKIPLFITNVHKDTAESDIIDYIKNE